MRLWPPGAGPAPAVDEFGVIVRPTTIDGDGQIVATTAPASAATLIGRWPYIRPGVKAGVILRWGEIDAWASAQAKPASALIGGTPGAGGGGIGWQVAEGSDR